MGPGGVSGLGEGEMSWADTSALVRTRKKKEKNPFIAILSVAVTTVLRRVSRGF
jgi:hypothetical protein